MSILCSDNQYIAIIGDIKESRKIINRGEVQEKLNAVLERVNNSYIDDITSKFVITLGDEFQGLLHCGDHCMHIITEIERDMYPVEIRFGVGIGEITTAINPQMAIGSDGPSYYRARAAIDFLRANEKRKQTDTSNLRFELCEKNHIFMEMMNTICVLLTVIMESWSPRQREVIQDMLKYQDSQVNVAKRLNIQQPTVQKILTRGRYYAYTEAMKVLENTLGAI